MSCAFNVRRRRLYIPCWRCARLCEVRADWLHFRITIRLCSRHRALLMKWKPGLRIQEMDPRDLESEVA